MAKKIKVYAVIGNTGGILESGHRAHYRLSIFGKKKHAKDMAKVAPEGWKVIPVEILFPQRSKRIKKA